MLGLKIAATGIVVSICLAALDRFVDGDISPRWLASALIFVGACALACVPTGILMAIWGA